MPFSSHLEWQRRNLSHFFLRRAVWVDELPEHMVNGEVPALEVPTWPKGLSAKRSLDLGGDSAKLHREGTFRQDDSLLMSWWSPTGSRQLCRTALLQRRLDVSWKSISLHGGKQP